MTGLDDLQADLDALAGATDAIADIVSVYRSPEGFQVDAAELRDVADRLRNLLTDRDLDTAPLTSEIIAHKEAGGKVQTDIVGRWVHSPEMVDWWKCQLNMHGDLRQHGYRLGVRKPATERVRLDQVPGKKLAHKTVTVRYLRWNDRLSRFEWCAVGTAWLPLDVAPDGTVEVLKDGSK